MIACNRYKSFAYVSALRTMTELAKKKQVSFSSIIKNVPNTNEASRAILDHYWKLTCREAEHVMILKLI